METCGRSCCIFRVRVTLLGRLRAERVDAQSICGSVHAAIGVWLSVSVLLAAIRAGGFRHPVGSSHGVVMASARQARTVESRKIRPWIVVRGTVVSGARA